jgi:hypothetical protein
MTYTSYKRNIQSNIIHFSLGIILMALIFSTTACSGGGPEVDVQATVDAAVAGTEQAKTDVQSTIDASVEATLQAKTAAEPKPATNTPTAEPTQTPTPGPMPTDAPTLHYSRKAEAYAVYSALIQTRYIDTQKPALIVITDQTGLDYFEGELGEHLEAIRQGLPDLTDEVCADFEAQNKQPQPLKSLFSINVKYVFISPQEIQTTFKKQDGWDIFYAKYPNAQGFMHLSGVGFNPQMDMALVYVDNMYYALAGEGYYVLLNKVNGQWTVQDQTMVWQS